MTVPAVEPPSGAAARPYRALTRGAWWVVVVVALLVFVLAWDPRLSLLRGTAPLALLLTAIGLRESGLLALVAVAGAAWGYGRRSGASSAATVDPAESPWRGFGGWSIALPVVGLTAISWTVAWRFGRGFWPAGAWLPIVFSIGATLAVRGRRALGNRWSPSRGAAWAILALAVVAIVIWLRLAVAPLPVPPLPRPAPPACDLVGADAFAGAEDLEVERDAAGRPVRLWVSADDRAHPSRGGGLFQMPLAADGHALDVPRTADMAGRDACSWHPQGLSLVTERDGSRRLYVVNHHDLAADSLAATAIWEGPPPCAPAQGNDGPAADSIEVYDLRGSTLFFRARWADERLTHPNDVAALPDGELVVSNMPSGVLGLAVETWRSAAGSSLALRHADGRWADLALPASMGGLRLANGVVAVPTGDGGALVYAVGRGRGGFPVAPGAVLHTLRLDVDRRVREVRTVYLAPGAADNLSLTAAGDALLVAIHEAPYRFALHAEDWRRGRERVEPSPWTVRTVDLDADGWPGGLHTELRSWATGQRFDAASVGVETPAGLWVGQVFGRGVLFCPD